MTKASTSTTTTTKLKKNKSNAKKRINPKKQKKAVQRLLKKKEPKVVENTKTALLLKGLKTSEVVSTALKDLSRLLNPHVKTTTKRNEIRPFEDLNSLEFLCQKNDCSLFTFVSHNKKRPDNLVMGRTYDGHVLDMVEFGVSNYIPLESFKGVTKKRIGSKPCMIFLGDVWEHEEKMQRVKNLLLDFFRGDDVSKISLAGMDYVAMFTAIGESIVVRHYTIQFKKSGGKVPRVVLLPMGPSMTLKMRRTQFASADLYKTACRQPAQLRPKKVKNESTNVFGDKVGRIHVGRQDLDTMKVKRVKALRKGRDGDLLAVSARGVEEEEEEEESSSSSSSPMDSEEEYEEVED